MTIKTQRILTRAKKLIKKGEIDQAKFLYSSILKSFPENQEAKKELLKLDQFQNINSKKEQIDAVMNLYSSNKMEEALSSVNLLVNEYPNDSLLCNISGACYSALDHNDAAIKCFERATKLQPDYAEAHFNLGVAFQKLKKIDSSIMSYENAIKFIHSYPAAHNNLGVIKLSQGEFNSAVKNFEWAIAYSPNYAEAHNNLGKTYQALRQYDAAKNQFEKAIQLNPVYPQAFHNLGVIYENLGLSQKALENYEKVIKHDKYFAEAYRNLSKLKTFLPEDKIIPQMQDALSNNNLSLSDKSRLCFALAKVNEDLGNHKEFFNFLDKGNKLRQEVLNYSINDSKNFNSKLQEIFSKPIPKIKTKLNNTSNINPIFIVGMPRSGTSLVEQILASHHNVYGAGELISLREIISPIFEYQISQNNIALSKEDIIKIYQMYSDSLSLLQVDEKVITDKMPTNFRLIGYILSAFPQAKIVHVKRDAIATCWSNYKHYFTDGNGFAYNQEDLVEFYSLYEELMAFWHKLFPNSIYDIYYEKLTSNQKIETKSLLDYCELSWDKNCLDFHKNERAVLTASSLQVRKKIYQGSSDSWKKYQQFLQPLIKGLKSY